MHTAATTSDLVAALALLDAPRPARMQAEHLRHFAAVQRRQGMGYIHEIGHTRRWATEVSTKYNPGVGLFYGADNVEYRAKALKFALRCRKLANKAAAEARAIESRPTVRVYGVQASAAQVRQVA